MKKSLFFAAVAALSLATVSCNKSYKAELYSDIDSLSYAYGVMNGMQMKGQMEMSGMDSTAYADFVRGFKEGAETSGDKKTEAYIMGLATGMQMTGQLNRQIFGGDSIYKMDVDNLVAGLVAGIKGNSVIDMENMSPEIETLPTRVRARVMEEKYGDNKRKGEQFLVENAKKEGVKTLPSGVQYKVIKQGEGPVATDTTHVTLNYEGKFINGEVFDSSKNNGGPVTIVPRQFVPGFAEALVNMPAGSTWEVYLPYDKAYGENGSPDGKIKPFSTLIFTIEVLNPSK